MNQGKLKPTEDVFYFQLIPTSLLPDRHLRPVFGN
jgi:hypothetical protein